MTTPADPSAAYRLDDHVAIITGAGKGIGAATAEAFARAGAASVLVARTQADLDQTAARIEALDGRALVMAGDVNDLDLLSTIVERTVDEFGRLDLLVNNAGGSVSHPFLDTTVDQLEDSFHFNVSVPFELSRLAVPHMLRTGAGAIVNIGSVAGSKAVRGSLTHSLTKSSLAQLTRLMAVELAPRIRVNAVLPGAIETAALKQFLSSMDPSVREEMIRRTAMRRNGTPEDIAQAVLFMASPASSWVTGKLLEVDGDAQHELIPRERVDL